MTCYAARVKDALLLRQSSSGGAFSAFANWIIENSGVVFGAVWADNNHKVKHVSTETLEGLNLMRGSKYVPSDISLALKNVPTFLAEGRPVLFTGTPCQIAAMRKIVGYSDKLYLVEIICHGVPELDVWREYLSFISRLYKASPEAITFKDKQSGWNNPTTIVNFSEGVSYANLTYDDPYIRAYMSGLSLREVCSHCQFKGARSGADITIGDFWGVENVFADWADNKGVSCVIVHTKAGQKLWSNIVESVDSREIELKNIIAYNPNYLTPPLMHPKHKRFISLYRLIQFDVLVTRMLDGNFFVRFCNHIMSAIKRRVLG